MQLLLKHLKHKGKEGAPLSELSQVLPSKTIRQVQHLLRLLEQEKKVSPARKGPGAPWKLACYISPDQQENKT